MAQHTFQHRALVFEAFEDRRVMAVTAALTNGVLQIQGDSSNNTITLSQVKGMVKISGTKLSFAANQISSIDFDGRGGQDSLRLDKLNVGQTRWSTQITVRQGQGGCSVVSTDLSNVFFGANSTLIVNGNGVTTLNGQAVDWFDRNIRSDALRQVLKEDFGDGQLTRSEILDALAAVRADGAVTKDEIADLKALALKTDLYGSQAHVGVLLKNMAVGNLANKTYQGTKLGNLAAAKNVTQFDNLVNKWFYGTDRPVAKYGATTFTYVAAAGNLFGNGGPALADVRQGLVGNCYYVAALAEMAQQSPTDIQNMFIVNGDGTYTVRFMNNGKADYVTVDSKLPVDQQGRFVYANYGQQANSNQNVLWVALAEKAYVQMNECAWLRAANRLPGNGVNSYAAIAGGYMSDALRQVTGKTASNIMISSTFGNSFQTVVGHFQAGKSIGFATHNGNTPNTALVGGHQYVMTGFDANARTITVFNPWGLNNGSSKPGLVTVSVDTMSQNFSYWTLSA